MEPRAEPLRIAVDAEQPPMRLDQYLSKQIKGMSRTKIQAAIHQGQVHINGKEVRKSSCLVQKKDLLEARLAPRPHPSEAVGEDIPLSIIYEDAHLAVVNKAAPMVVHPAHGHWTGTLVHALLYRMGHLPRRAGSEHRPGLLHRIDKGTSGLLVVAKSEQALTHIAAQFMHHQVERTYCALVWGQVAEERGTIRAPLARRMADRRVMEVCPPGDGRGKEAITHYQVEERLSHVTRLSCRLETGRTHQIRAHMKHLGHPLFGDARYGGAEIVCGPCFSKYKAFVKNCLTLLPHQALHAATLGFIHPESQKKVSFTAPLPPSFAQVLQRWRTFSAAKK